MFGHVYGDHVLKHLTKLRNTALLLVQPKRAVELRQKLVNVLILYNTSCFWIEKGPCPLEPQIVCFYCLFFVFLTRSEIA